ncbi:MAG TPA: RuBisCO large subunit C-terminal-like domain-containing protein [Candidatus Norongarragalinales archaeon]|jgi:ribulose-bisphosphate carboxylase large chain|nr:RuBisCO large subunit C-terminal-like domain-containing protein [Candidatus Norongarragalinales archaeon]
MIDMNPAENFLRKDIDPSQHVIATYYFESADPEKAVIELCKESSTSLKGRMGVDENFPEKHGAKLVEFEHKGNIAACKIAHPVINFGSRLPNLLTEVAGEGVYDHGVFQKIRLLDLEFPHEFLKHFTGPRFGKDGWRKILNIHHRPIICSVLKPGVGAKPEVAADQALKAFMGGLDIGKDDETVSDTAYSPTAKRLELVMDSLHKAEDATGEKKMYVCNITDETDKMLELYDLVASYGDSAGVMVVPAWTGLSAMRMLAKDGRVPIFAHFAGGAAMTRSNDFGIAPTCWTKLQRIAGADLIINENAGGRMPATPEDVRKNAQACTMPMSNIAPTMPAFGAGDWVKSFYDTYKNLGTTDFTIIIGRRVFTHPSGPSAGARAFRQTCEAIEKGVTPDEYAKTHSELREAIEAMQRVTY